MPIRIQRKRIKGWRMPENTVSVTRPGEFGNPFKIGGYYLMGDKYPSFTSRPTYGTIVYMEALEKKYADERYENPQTIDECLALYKRYLAISPNLPNRVKEKLRGKNLACFCKEGSPCHADILLELANQNP